MDFVLVCIDLYEPFQKAYWHLLSRSQNYGLNEDFFCCYASIQSKVIVLQKSFAAPFNKLCQSLLMH